MRKLTFKQKKFIDFYNGNATQAALDAGYSSRTAYAIGVENLKKPHILKEIQGRNKEENMEKIATREQRQEFWSSIMNDFDEDILVRLKASELLGKSEADFTQRVVSGVPIDLAERIKAARERADAEMTVSIEEEGEEKICHVREE